MADKEKLVSRQIPPPHLKRQGPLLKRLREYRPRLNFDEIFALAEADGCTDDPIDEFIRFFEPRIPFLRVVITWPLL